jgi:hypothetical protein
VLVHIALVAAENVEGAAVGPHGQAPTTTGFRHSARFDVRPTAHATTFIIGQQIQALQPVTVLVFARVVLARFVRTAAENVCKKLGIF